jgi:hypothetical protein
MAKKTKANPAIYDETMHNLDDDVKQVSVESGTTSSDADMPVQQTADYTPTYKLTQTFHTLFNKAIGDMPYSSLLVNANEEKIKLTDIVKFINIKKDNITIDELNIIIGFISNSAYKYVHEFMDVVSQNDKQSLLWQLNS